MSLACWANLGGYRVHPSANRLTQVNRSTLTWEANGNLLQAVRVQFNGRTPRMVGEYDPENEST